MERDDTIRISFKNFFNAGLYIRLTFRVMNIRPHASNTSIGYGSIAAAIIALEDCMRLRNGVIRPRNCPRNLLLRLNCLVEIVQDSFEDAYTFRNSSILIHQFAFALFNWCSPSTAELLVYASVSYYQLLIFKTVGQRTLLLPNLSIAIGGAH